MTKFDKEFFQKLDFTKEQIGKYFKSAQKDLIIAGATKIPEVIFKFSYEALIKIGITLIAYKGYKIRSKTGHHVKIIEIISELLKDNDVEAIGNMMRRHRNFDLYSGGTIITEKQSEEYMEFAKRVFSKAEKYIYGKV